MIDWKAFTIGLLGGTCILLFIASIDQREQYEKQVIINEQLKLQLSKSEESFSPEVFETCTGVVSIDTVEKWKVVKRKGRK